MSDNSIELSGIFSGGYGIIPKNLMKMKLNERVGKSKGKNIKLVLAYMLSYTGAGKDTCFPSIQTISDDLEVSKDVVVEAIKNAANLGLITKGQMYPDNPLKHNNIYKLDFLNSLPSNIEIRTSRTTCTDGSTFAVVSVEQNSNMINNNKSNKSNSKKTSSKENTNKPLTKSPLTFKEWFRSRKDALMYYDFEFLPLLEKEFIQMRDDVRGVYTGGVDYEPYLYHALKKMNIHYRKKYWEKKKLPSKILPIQVWKDWGFDNAKGFINKVAFDEMVKHIKGIK